MWNLIWDLKSILENSVQFFLFTILMCECPSKNKENHARKAFEQKDKETWIEI